MNTSAQKVERIGENMKSVFEAGAEQERGVIEKALDELHEYAQALIADGKKSKENAQGGDR